jgi:hypothetical protein
MPDVDETVQWKPRRGTTVEHATFVGAADEVTLDTDLDQLVIHDGATPGGSARHPTIQQLVQAKHWFATVTGTNTLTFDLGAPYRPAAYTTGHVIAFKPAANNTTAVTINVTGSGGTGLGAKDLQKLKNGALAALVAGDLVAAVPTIAIYDGTRYVLVSGAGGGGLGENIDSDAISDQTSSDFQSIPSDSLVERLVFDHVKNVAGAVRDVYLRVEVGGAFRATAGDYQYARSAVNDAGTASGAGSNSATQLLIFDALKATTGVVSGIVDCYNPGAGNNVVVDWKLTGEQAGGAMAINRGGGLFKGTTGAVTGLRVLFNTGNIGAGTIYRQRLSIP